MFDLIAQGALQPPPSDEAELYPWIVGVLVTALGALVTYVVNGQKAHKDELERIRSEHERKIEELLEKREQDHKKMMRIALRTQRILATVSGVTGQDQGDVEDMFGRSNPDL